MQRGKPKADTQLHFFRLERAFADKFKYGAHVESRLRARPKHFEMVLRFFCSHVNIISKAQYSRKFHTTQSNKREQTLCELLNAYFSPKYNLDEFSHL
jgi:hypothetical protein